MRFSSWTVTGLLTVMMMTTTTMVTADGVQSGPNKGPLYAGGMSYTSSGGFAFVTGITYDDDFGFLETSGSASPRPSCFVASILVDPDDGSLDFEDQTTVGDPNVLESCQALATLEPSGLIAVGNSEPDGDYASDDQKMSGFAVSYDRAGLVDTTGIVLDSSVPDKIPYPMDVITQGKNDVYVVSLTSTDDTLSSTAGLGSFPNWILQLKYGTSVDMAVHKLAFFQDSFNGIPSGKPTLSKVWTQEFPIQPDPADNNAIPRVYIGGALIKDSKFLLVAGSTRGLGPAYGPAEGDDEDGFVSVLDTATGELAQDHPVKSKRYGSAEDDIVTGICDDPNDPNAFFIVGATEGDLGGTKAAGGTSIAAGSLQGWIRKIQFQDLSSVWTVQFGSVLPGSGTTPTEAYGISCAVVGGTVYVGGGVYGGASMVHQDTVLPNFGGNDIWAARLDKTSGAIDWMKQYGSPDGNDNLARNGGVAVTANENLLLYGDTTGSLFRDRQGEADKFAEIFVMSINKEDGELQGMATVDPDEDSEFPSDIDFSEEPSDTDFPSDSEMPFVTSRFTIFGHQLEGPMFGGGLAFDSSLQTVLFTGSTYKKLSSPDHSSCMVGAVDMESGYLLETQNYGTDTTPEFCSSIAFSDLSNKAFVVGGTEQGGYLTNQGATPNPSATQVGFIFSTDDDAVFEKYAISDTSAVTYPVAVVGDAKHLMASFVLSFGSDSGVQTTSPAEQFPNLSGTGTRKFGSDYYAIVQRFTGTEEGGLLTASWRQSFATTAGSVYPSSMTVSGNGSTLVVVGSTKGSGGVFGTNTRDDMDGFIFKLNPETGTLIDPGPTDRASTRLDSQNNKDDWITHVCNDRFDHDAFYVVGATMGKIRDIPDSEQAPEGTIHSFVAKVTVQNLQPEWIKHFRMSKGSADGTPGTSAALACTVTSNRSGGSGAGNLVYVAGVVENGGVIKGADVETSHGKDDIFVIQLDGDDGDVKWKKQIGTSGNDRLAKGGALDVDDNGNLMVLAETTGSMFRTRPVNASPEDHDLVVFTMSKADGVYHPMTEKTGTTPGPVTPPVRDADLPDDIVAIQTGPSSGPLYAGGMAYDRFTNSLYVTGAAYADFPERKGSTVSKKSSCFFGTLILPRLTWREQANFGTQVADEACNAISLTTFDNRASAIVVGSTESNGVLTEFGKNTGVAQYGFALDLLSTQGEHGLQGGALMEDSKVQYPVSVLASEEEEDKVYIVSMVSKDTVVSADFDKVRKNKYPNLTTGGIEKFGDKYAIVVERHTMIGSQGDGTALEQTLILDWRRPFQTADGEAVFVSGMVEVRGELIIVGSTRGRPNSQDMDGVMAKINRGDGEFAIDGAGSRTVAYFASVTDGDDWIFNACPDTNDDDHFYVVGATTGTIDEQSQKRSNNDISVNAVVSKINVDTLSPVWTRQFSVTPASGQSSSKAAAAAYGCAVIEGAGEMYVAGNVENGGVIDTVNLNPKSAGRDDIWVAKMDTETGNTMWIQQVGSNGDDRVAHGGCVAADANGNAVVYGDTNGSFYRERNNDKQQAITDIFVMIMDQKDGSHLPPLVGKKLPKAAPSKEFFPKSNNSGAKTLTFGIVALVLLALIGIFFLVLRRRNRKRSESQKSSIFGYLQRFDVEDIDLRKSPPGGWHGTYLNRLAYGINNSDGTEGRLPEVEEPDDTYDNTALTHSSVVRDSLFMDTGSRPSLGYRDDPNAGQGLDSYGDTPNQAEYHDQPDNFQGKEVI